MPLVLSGSTGIVEANIADSAITTNKIATGAVSAADLASTLDLSTKSLSLPAINSAMIRIYSNDISTAISSIDLDLSAQTFQAYKLYIRNWNLSSNSYPVLRKMTASNTAVGSCYGGGTRSGEGVTAHVQYGGADSFYLLGDTTTATESANTYLMAWDITILRQSNNMIQMFGNGVARTAGGRSQNVNTGCVDINTGTFWGIRIGSPVTTSNIKYAIYGVNAA